MIKKYSKLFLIALFSFFISKSPVLAVEMSLEELGNEVLDRAEVKGETYDYLYIVGQHAFTSNHELTLEDLMLGARTIQLSEDAGRTDSDSIYNEMTTYTLNAHVNDDFEIDGYEVGINFTGTSEVPTSFEIQYIDGEKIGEATSIVDHITDSIDYVSNKITNKYINEVTLNDIYDKASLLDKENSTTSDYLYVVGQYAFSSNHTLTIEDLMLGATTIETIDKDFMTKDTKNIASAISKDGYSINYIEYYDDDAAKDFFNETYDKYENSCNIKTETNGTNYNTFKCDTGEEYIAITRVENTVVYALTTKNNKDEVKETLKKLKY